MFGWAAGSILYLANFDQRVKCGLPAWEHVGIDNITGLGRKDRISTGQAVDAKPAVAHPDNPRLQFFAHFGLRAYAPSLVVDLDMAVGGNASLLGIERVNP